jgi:Protein of unknown function (DUF3667)
LVSDALEETLSLDGSLVRSFVRLGKPGALTRDWIEGRRASFVSPLRLYLMSSLALFLVVGALGFPTAEFPSGLMDTDASISPALRQASSALRGELRRAVTLAVLLLVPVMTLILKAMRPRKSLVIDHVVFSLHYFSAFFLSWALAWPAMVLAQKAGISAPTNLILGGCLFVYLVVALRNANGTSWPRATGAAIGVPFLAVLMVATIGRPAAVSLGNRLGGAYGRWEVATVDEADRLYTEWRADPAHEGHLGLVSLSLFETVTPIQLSDHQNVHLVDLHLAMGDSARAVEVLERVLRRSPRHPLVLAQSVALAFAAGDSAVATARLEALRAVDDSVIGAYADAFSDHPAMLSVVTDLRAGS